jgi:protoporphyrin/coproporphyrin ferrochelatase
MKLAVVLFNLGGPDVPEAIEPFLRNLFGDPAIITLPGLLRRPLAWLIARRRAPVARNIYARIGGRSPILPETEAQAAALARELGEDVRVFIAMRYWTPFSGETAKKIRAWSPDRIVLLPLYPQFSTTTTGSSFADWTGAAAKAGLTAPTSRICCYPALPGFIAALADLARNAMAMQKPGISYRLLLSAHGLPKRIIAKGDPYQLQVEQTAAALVRELGIADHAVCYQSRVGPLEWIGPSTDAEIRRAGADGKGIVLVPVAFVSEHSETLVELDIEYAHLAERCGVADYIRVPAAGCHAMFVKDLARLVRRRLDGEELEHCCPAGTRGCAWGKPT